MECKCMNIFYISAIFDLKILNPLQNVHFSQFNYDKFIGSA